MMYHIVMNLSLPETRYVRGLLRLMPLRGLAWGLLLSVLVVGQTTTVAHEASPFCDEELCELCEGGAADPASAPKACVSAGEDKFRPLSEVFVVPGYQGDRSVAMVRAPPTGRQAHRNV